MADENNGEGEGPELVSLAQAFTGLPIESLIGGPLMAAAKANHQMACDQVNYLLSTCFSRIGEGNNTSYKPVMISMTVSRPGLTAPLIGGPSAAPGKVEVIESSINVPLLTLIPLNSLAVTSVDITFDMEVKSSYCEDHKSEDRTKEHSDGGFTGEGWIGPFKCTIHGSVSSDSSHTNEASSKYSKSNEAHYHIEVTAAQMPAPPGIGVIIQAFANNIGNMTMPQAVKA